mgnify:CR=1 FL=1
MVIKGQVFYRWRSLLLACFAIVVCGAFYCAVDYAYSREVSLYLGKVNAVNQSNVRSLEIQFSRTFNKADNMLLLVKAAVEQRGAIDPGQLSRVSNFREMDPVNRIAVFDAKGNLVFSTTQANAGFTIADKEYFQALAVKDNQGMYLDKPGIDPLTGSLSVFLSRRLNDRDGNFIGIVSAGLPQDYFAGLFRQVGMANGNTVVLLRKDGLFLARVPGGFSDQQATTFREHPVIQLVSQGSNAGVYESPGKADGVSRIGAYRALDNYPVVVMATVEKEEALEEVYDQRTLYRYAIIGFVLFILLSCAVIEWRMRKQDETEEQLRYHGYHDVLTGLPNRVSLYETLEKLETTGSCGAAVIMADVDGLKLINDTFGHTAGDQMLLKTAGLLVECTPQTAIVTRMGSDEFAILLPEINEDEAQAVCAKIRGAVTAWNSQVSASQFPLEISLGIAVVQDTPGSLTGLIVEADRSLYREKLAKLSHTGNHFIPVFREQLIARDFVADGHIVRVRNMTVQLAEKMEIAADKLPAIELFAQYHDIGKVGIPDRILNKEGCLAPEEEAEIHRHSEIGYRIAAATKELAPIASWILLHHERWDGKGYPLGVAGEEIPLECRILAVADSFDAMISDRPYRKALTRTQALSEVRRNSGSQFDPDVVQVFVELYGGEDRG